MNSSENRYQRQEQVPMLGASSHVKLGAAHVLLVGAGGLGSPVGLFLAGAGVGELTLIDADKVSLSNLHRQILFQETDVGRAKVEAAKARLNALNRNVKINSINASLSIKNVQQLVEKATVVVDAADNFLSSYLLSDECFEQRTPLVSASVLTTHGYLGVFCGTQAQPAPSLRAVFPAPSPDVANCNTAGVTGPSVGIIGSYQAQETLKVIMEDPSQLLAKLMYLELWGYRQSIIDFSGAGEPQNKAGFVAIDALSCDDVVLDLCSMKERQQTPLAKLASNIMVINIPLSSLAQEQHRLPRNRRIVCVCRSGQRALSAAQWLIENGHIDSAITSQ